jgi:hypothetical protein
MEMVSFVFLGISIGAFMLLPMICSIERQRNRFLQRARQAERKKQAAYDDYCEVVKERDRLDSAIGWWHEWHDTLRRALGLMYCDTSVTLAGAKQLMTTLRAQAAIHAIDQAHLRYSRQQSGEREPAPESCRCEAWKECAQCSLSEPHIRVVYCAGDHCTHVGRFVKCIPVQDE